MRILWCTIKHRTLWWLCKLQQSSFSMKISCYAEKKNFDCCVSVSLVIYAWCPIHFPFLFKQWITKFTLLWYPEEENRYFKNLSTNSHNKTKNKTFHKNWFQIIHRSILCQSKQFLKRKSFTSIKLTNIKIKNILPENAARAYSIFNQDSHTNGQDWNW